MKKIFFVSNAAFSSREFTKQVKSLRDALSHLNSPVQQYDVQTISEIDDETLKRSEELNDSAHPATVIFFGAGFREQARKLKKKALWLRVIVIVRDIPIGEVSLVPFSWLYGFKAIQEHLLSP